MIIDLSEIIKNYGGKMSVSATIEMNDTDFLGESFTFYEPLNINGEIINNTKSLELSAKVTGSVRAHCARCGKPVAVPVKFRLNEVLVNDESKVGEDDDVIVFSDNKLDMSDIVLNGFLMSVSGKYLCRDDCKGLCPKCGADLNDGDCACEKEEIDPRWADLQKIMNSMTDTE